MFIRAGYEITYECPTATPMTLLLSIRPERLPDLATPPRIEATAPTPLRQFRDVYGNIAHRLLAPAGPVTFRSDFVIEDMARGLGARVTPVRITQHHPRCPGARQSDRCGLGV